MSCIFCGSTEQLTSEHVFPAFMGGKLELPNGSCVGCNRNFGKSESTIATATQPLLNLLKIKNRRGKAPSARLHNVTIRGIDLSGVTAYMDGNGDVQLKDFVKEVVTDEGLKMRSGFFATKKGADTFAARESAKGGKLIEREVPAEIVIEGEYTQQTHFAFAFDTRRIAAKIALAAIAFECGRDFACSSQFDGLRNIRLETDVQKLPVRIFANTNVSDSWIRTPYQHSVRCYLSAKWKKGWAVVTLFGGLSYWVEVCVNYTTGREKLLSIFYDANTRKRVHPILLNDEEALAGEVLSPRTKFEDRDAVDAQWYPIVSAFCSDKGTIIERIKQP